MMLPLVLQEALPIITQFAPKIGGAIGGPVGIAAAYIIPILAQVFSSSPGDLKQLATNILKDPDASTKLETVEHEHGDWVCAMIDSVSTLSKAEINVKLEWQNPYQKAS
jgi:hypothetical protein